MSDERPYGCREWRARKDRDGYGRITIDGRTKSAHRAAYEAFVGPIPDGMTVDHLCFNRSCVEVAHLRLLTVSQNCANRQGSGAA